MTRTLARPVSSSPTLRAYLRRSTDGQIGSLDRQRETCRARAVALALDWNARVEYIDDDRARDDYAGHAAWHRMLQEIAPGDTVLVDERSRVGSDLDYLIALRDLTARGATVITAAGETLTYKRGTAGIIEYVQGARADDELTDLRRRTLTAMRERVRGGFVAGYVPFGYSTVRVGADGAPVPPERQRDKKAGKVRAFVNPAQADIVIKIFRMYVDGAGEMKIARTLDAEGVPPPRTNRKRGSRSWHEHTIHEILGNERYRGVYTHGRTIKVKRGGRRVRTVNPHGIDRVEIHEWRIVHDDLWYAVQAERERRKRPGGTGNVNAARALFVGMARCQCGGTISIATCGDSPSDRFYTCTRRRRHGTHACSARIYQPTGIVERTVLDWIRSNLLDPDAVERLIGMVRERMAQRARRSATDDPDVLDAEIATLRKQIGRLTALAAASDDPIEGIASEIRTRQDRIRALQAHAAAARAACAPVDVDTIERATRETVADLRATLAQPGAPPRDALRRLYPSGFRFSDSGEGVWMIEAEATIGSGGGTLTTTDSPDRARRSEEPRPQGVRSAHTRRYESDERRRGRGLQPAWRREWVLTACS
ncbi:MAG TPA: recombinase family protein [Polyangiaceae bacterium]|nr:recombinase family protein [Polyangiaceae bacterium]